MFHGDDAVRLIGSLQVKMVWSYWKNTKSENAKRNCNNYNGRKIRLPRKIWRDEVEEGLIKYAGNK
jgi:hypothetical protein